MYRWALILPMAFLAGSLLAADKEKPAPKTGDKKKAAPLVDVDAFMREYDRNKDGMLSKAEMPEWLHYNFSRLDTNKDGKISKDELHKGAAYLQRRGRPSDTVLILIEMSDCDDGCAEEAQRAYQLLYKLDKNKDGKLDANELKAGREQILRDRVARIMKRLDADKDGKISRAEARGLLKEHFDQLDTNKDGFVDQAELTAGAAAKHAKDKEHKGKEDKKPAPRREK